MFRATAILALCVGRLGRLASAAPILERAASGSLGVAYFISNSEGGNQIVANNIEADGTLSFASVTPTGGKGSFGAEAPPTGHTPHGDALFSQQPITLLSDNTLLAVNPGSNTLSMFSVDAADPTKLSLKSTVSSGGQFPMSVAVSKKSNMACVLNSAGAGNVKCFSTSGGKLKAIENGDITAGFKQQSNPPLGPGATVSMVLFDNRNRLVTSTKGTSTEDPGFLEFHSVTNNAIGKGVKVPAATGGGLPFGMSAALDGSDQLFVTDAAAGVSVFTGGPTGQSTLTPVTGNNATCWSTQSKATGSFFSVDIGTSNLTEHQVSFGVAAPINQYSVGNGVSPTDAAVASTRKGDFLYVLLPGAQSIGTLAVGKQPGQAKLIQTLALKDKVKGLTISMAGMAVLVK